MRLSNEIWSTKHRVSEVDGLFLLQDFTEEKAWNVIKDMPVNSAPGPDGFSNLFYKFFWG